MTSEKKTRTAVDLIPWDPESEEHVQRMFDQRVACGWKSNFVEKWKIRQREGTMTLQWVVLRNDDPNTEARLAQHAAKFPNESRPLTDTATSYGGKDRTPPSPPRSFIPVGHLSLDSFSEAFPDNVDPSNGVYTITSLYVSDALQSGGIGNAAMDTVENLAKGSPLYAKAITLDCIAARHSKDPVFYASRGLNLPKVAVQDWYERRGYEVYDSREDAYVHVDPTLEGMGLSGVLMRKRLVD